MRVLNVQEATKGPKEKLLYVPCVTPDGSRPDYLATVDADPLSATYSSVRVALTLTLAI